jgi:hypothetical protein
MSLLLYARAGPPNVVLPIVFAATLLTLGGALAEQTQTNPASSYDPLQAFVGTWTATNPNETAPYMSLKFEETNGQLTGTISHFKIAVARSGRLLGTLVDAGTSPIANIQVSHGDLDFVWAGAAPWPSGPAKFCIEGTSRARVIFLLNSDGMKQILAAYPGLGAMNPVILVSRESKSEAAPQASATSEKWIPEFMARLINTAEAQYKYEHGNYADYAMLVHSGQLADTDSREFKIQPELFHSSEADPLPGYDFRLSLASDSKSYQLSIVEKAAMPCGTNLFSSETGLIFQGRPGDCPAK